MGEASPDRPAVPDGIMDTIRRLAEMRVDRGCTPAEAGAAAAKLEELLERWQLSQFDIETQEYGEDIAEEDIELPSWSVPAWTWSLARAVARPHDCEYFANRKAVPGPPIAHVITLRFVGHRSDAAVASYLYTTLARLLMDMADRDGRALGRRSRDLIRYKSQFVQAAADEVFNRLWRERKKAREATGGASTALVVVKEGAVKEYVGQHYPRISKTSSRRTPDPDCDALLRGREAGRSVPLRKGVDGGDARPQIPG